MIATVSASASIAFIAFLVFPVWELGGSIALLTGKIPQTAS